jgi:hypothetical protein
MYFGKRCGFPVYRYCGLNITIDQQEIYIGKSPAPLKSVRRTGRKKGELIFYGQNRRDNLVFVKADMHGMDLYADISEEIENLRSIILGGSVTPLDTDVLGNGVVSYEILGPNYGMPSGPIYVVSKACS